MIFPARDKFWYDDDDDEYKACARGETPQLGVWFGFAAAAAAEGGMDMFFRGGGRSSVPRSDKLLSRDDIIAGAGWKSVGFRLVAFNGQRLSKIAHTLLRRAAPRAGAREPALSLTPSLLIFYYPSCAIRRPINPALVPLSIAPPWILSLCSALLLVKR